MVPEARSRSEKQNDFVVVVVKGTRGSWWQSWKKVPLKRTLIHSLHCGSLTEAMTSSEETKVWAFMLPHFKYNTIQQFVLSAAYAAIK